MAVKGSQFIQVIAFQPFRASYTSVAAIVPAAEFLPDTGASGNESHCAGLPATREYGEQSVSAKPLGITITRPSPGLPGCKSNWIRHVFKIVPGLER